VGESKEDMQRILRHTAPRLALPGHRRYLMGVGHAWRTSSMPLRAESTCFDCVNAYAQRPGMAGYFNPATASSGCAMARYYPR